MRTLLYAASILAAPALALAQVPVIEMTATPQTVGLNQTFQLEIRVTVQGGTADDIEVPDVSAFDVEARSVSRPMQFSFGFGQSPVIQSTTVHTLTLRPRRTGTFPIRPVQVVVGGQRFQGPATHVTVVQGGAPQSPPGSPLFSPLVPLQPNAPTQDVPPFSPLQPVPPAQPPGGLGGARYDDEIFVRTTLDRERAYIGQQVTMTLYVYTRASVSDLDVTREPGTEGFWTEDLIGPVRRLDFTDTEVDGTHFQVAVLRKVALFPMRAGTLTVTPGSIEAETRRGLFSRGARLTADGIPVAIEVLPLPADGQPRGFDPSNVGQYRLEASLDRDRVSGGDAVTLTVKVSGQGNVRQLRLPTIASDGDFRVLPPQVRDRVVTEHDRVGGERTWEFFVTPQRAGDLPVPTVRLGVFDPEARTYTTLESPPLVVHVIGAPPVATGDEVTSPLGPAIRSIRGESELRRAGRPIVRSLPYLAAAGAPPGIVFALFVGRTIRDRRRRSEGDRPRRALGDAKKRLRAAGVLAKTGDAAGVFSAVAHLLQGYLEDRLVDRVGHDTMDDLRRRLEGRGYPPELAESVVRELENCDFARFTPASVRDREMQECLSRTAALLEELEKVEPSRLS